MKSTLFVFLLASVLQKVFKTFLFLRNGLKCVIVSCLLQIFAPENILPPKNFWFQSEMRQQRKENVLCQTISWGLMQQICITPVALQFKIAYDFHDNQLCKKFKTFLN